MTRDISPVELYISLRGITAVQFAVLCMVAREPLDEVGVLDRLRRFVENNVFDFQGSSISLGEEKIGSIEVSEALRCLCELGIMVRASDSDVEHLGSDHRPGLPPDSRFFGFQAGHLMLTENGQAEWTHIDERVLRCRSEAVTYREGDVFYTVTASPPSICGPCPIGKSLAHGDCGLGGECNISMVKDTGVMYWWRREYYAYLVRCDRGLKE